MDGDAHNRIPSGILIGLLGMLILSILQSISFALGFQNITMHIAIGILIMVLFLPIYRAECFLGHVLGATVTFGPVIPLLVFRLWLSFQHSQTWLLNPCWLTF